MEHRKNILVFVLAAALGLTSGMAAAQPYPIKPVRMIVPFPPGGATGLLARRGAQNQREGIGRQHVADNAPGAGAGARAVTRVPPAGAGGARRCRGGAVGLDGGPSCRLEEVGRAVNVTGERIRQIENHTLKKLEPLPEAQRLRDTN